jgi:hypothetical protein
MMPEKVRVEELSREDLQALVLQLMDIVRELEEQLRVKRTPPNSKNSSQPPSRDFKYEVICPCCGETQRGRLPAGLEAGRYFGPRREALVTVLHHEHHIGFERLTRLCGEVFNLPLSEGGAVAIVKRAGQAVFAEAERIGEQVRRAP